MGSPLYIQLVLEKEHHLSYDFEHVIGLNNSFNWYQSYVCTPNDVVGTSGAIPGDQSVQR